MHYISFWYLIILISFIISGYDITPASFNESIFLQTLKISRALRVMFLNVIGLGNVMYEKFIIPLRECVQCMQWNGKVNTFIFTPSRRPNIISMPKEEMFICLSQIRYVKN